MSKYAVIDDYNRANYCQIALRIPKNKKIMLQELADIENVSINKLIINAIEKTYGVSLKKDSK